MQWVFSGLGQGTVGIYAILKLSTDEVIIFLVPFSFPPYGPIQFPTISREQSSISLKEGFLMNSFVAILQIFGELMKIIRG